MSHPKPALPLPSFTRRTLLQAALATAGTVGLSACGGGGTGGSAPTSKTLTMGAYQGDEVPRNAFKAMVEGYQGTAEPKINFVDHETFKNNINNYLQGNPDDVFTWFAGYRSRFFAKNGLVGDLSDIWADFKGFPESMKNASSTPDGKQVLVPSTYYPWGVFYRPSVWKKHGYTPPKDKAEWLALCEKMKGDQIVPMAFAAKGGWEPMGTFDQLNLRVNGYQFHVSLMDGAEAWDGEKVRNVFKAWDEFIPFQQSDALGRTWQEGAQSLLTEKTGMMVIGMFIGQQFAASKKADDLDFFMYPEFDPAIGTDAIEAPIDGFMMAAKPKNKDGAKDMLKYLATAGAVNRSLKIDSSVIGANSDASQETYSALQKKAVGVIAEAKNISQFLDRDTRPDFASTVVGPALQAYIKKPSDIDSILKNIEQQKKSIFG